MREIYQRGCQDALQAFGCVKEAVDWSALGRGAKEFMIGRPLDYGKQLISGEAFRSNGMLRNAFTGGGPGTPVYQRVLHAAGIGLPTALMIPQLLHTPATHRGTAAGQFGGSLLGSILGSPLGVVGQIGGSMAGEALGGYLGSHLNTRDHRKRQVAEADEASQPPMNRGRVLSNTMSEVTGRPTDL